MLGDTNNTLNLGNLYPAANSFAPSTGSEADSIGVTTEHVSQLSGVEAKFGKAISLGQPVAAWIAIAVLLVLAMILATYFRTPERPAANLRFSIYNVVIVTLLSISGGAIAKAAAAHWSDKLGPVATIVLAS